MSVGKVSLKAGGWFYGAGVSVRIVTTRSEVGVLRVVS